MQILRKTHFSIDCLPSSTHNYVKFFVTHWWIKIGAPLTDKKAERINWHRSMLYISVKSEQSRLPAEWRGCLGPCWWWCHRLDTPWQKVHTNTYTDTHTDTRTNRHTNRQAQIHTYTETRTLPHTSKHGCGRCRRPGPGRTLPGQKVHTGALPGGPPILCFWPPLWG